MRRLICFAAAVLLCTIWPHQAAAQWPRINRKLMGKKPAIAVRKVVLLPAHVEFVKLGAKGSEGGIPESEQIADTFYTAVSRELAQRGIEVLPDPWQQAKSADAKYAIADLQAKYDDVVVQVRRKPGRVEKGAVTMGDRVAKFEPATGADALVFIRGFGEALTPGRKAISLATGNWFGTVSSFYGEVTLVDARSGELLAFIRFRRSRDVRGNTEERLSGSLRQALRDVPLPLPPQR